MKTIIAVLSPSSLKNKKYEVIIKPLNSKNFFQLNFGDSRYEDYTIHKNEQRKMNYINRHKANEDWTNIYSAGFWSRWLLWNKKTINESMEDMSNKFGIKFTQ